MLEVITFIFDRFYITVKNYFMHIHSQNYKTTVGKVLSGIHLMLASSTYKITQALLVIHGYHSMKLHGCEHVIYKYMNKEHTDGFLPSAVPFQYDTCMTSCKTNSVVIRITNEMEIFPQMTYVNSILWKNNVKKVAIYY